MPNRTVNVFNRIGYHVGSLTWVPRQSTRAGGSIRWNWTPAGSTRDLSTALSWPDIPHAERRLGELIAATPTDNAEQHDA